MPRGLSVKDPRGCRNDVETAAALQCFACKLRLGHGAFGKRGSLALRIVTRERVVHIRPDIEDVQQATGQGRQQHPADEAEAQNEVLPFVPFHHAHGELQRIGRPDVLTVGKNIGRERIGDRFDDAGDHEPTTDK